MKKTIVQSPLAPAAIGPYSQAVSFGGTLYTSGQIGLIPETGALCEGLEAQTKQALSNLRHVLNEAGMDYEHVLKTTVYLTDMADFSAVNDLYSQAFPKNPPARSCVAVKALPKGALVEIECIAAKE